MSFRVIKEVSEFLRHTLFLGLQANAETAQLVQNEDDIVLANPGQTTTAPGVKRRLSLWLYQVSPNEHLRNQPAVRRSSGPPPIPQSDDVLFHPPLGLNLCYLLTPSVHDNNGVSKEVDDQVLLGRAMQVLHDQSILRMPWRHLASNPLAGEAHELHVSLAPRTIEELAQVWEAMQQPYRLSVCYEVRAVRVDSERRLTGGRVVERRADFAEASA